MAEFNEDETNGQSEELPRNFDRLGRATSTERGIDLLDISHSLGRIVICDAGVAQW